MLAYFIMSIAEVVFPVVCDGRPSFANHTFSKLSSGRTKRKTPIRYEKYACVLADAFGEGSYSDDELETGIVEHIQRVDMTVEMCAMHCFNKRYIVLSEGNRCGCCSTANSFTFLKKVDGDLCSVFCQGDNNEICGGKGMYSVYRTNNLERNIASCKRHNHCQHGGFCAVSKRRRFRRHEQECKCESGFRGDHCEIRIKVCDESGRNPCGPNSVCNDLVAGGFSCACIQGYVSDKGRCVSSDDVESTFFEEQAVEQLVEKQQEIEKAIADAEERQRLALEKEKEISSRLAMKVQTQEEPVVHIQPVAMATVKSSPETKENVVIENALARKAVEIASQSGIQQDTLPSSCTSGFCQNDGRCTDVGSIMICTCQPGYNGNRCQIVVNRCKDVHCRNGGTCVSDGKGFDCSCKPGYAGLMCETNIDECLSNPCQNDGLCVDHIDAYECECPAGFTGDICQMDIDECASNPCAPNGKCNNGRDQYECVCDAGFKGFNCGNDINECESAPCNNHGFCQDQPNSFTCKCDPGFEGSQCQLNIDECASCPCQNNGECIDGNNEFSCHCAKGYGGVYCQIDMDECGSAPCQNNAVCINKIGCFVCECMNGFSGPLCEHEIDECASGPCMYGGECVDRVGYYTCTCATGFKGWNCELDIDECESAPCGMHAHCFNLAGNFMCACLPGFTGTFCEREVNECASSPCPPTEQCEDDINGYHCAKLLCVEGQC